jgi:hypothetical protein
VRRKLLPQRQRRAKPGFPGNAFNRQIRVSSNAKIVAVHMDAINHMSLTRDELRSYVQKHGIESRVDIPSDGASLEF